MIKKIKTIELSDLFTKKEMKEVLALMNKNEWNLVRKYFNDRKDNLEKKGVVADYLYYYLLNKFGRKNG